MNEAEGSSKGLPRRAATRTAKLAALPMGYAGRKALGLGKRIGGKPAEAVLADVHQRTADQLFRTLGELKGGAMKFGQMLSIMEAALPESQAAHYRAQLTRLQDSAPPMPTGIVRGLLARDLGPDWASQLVELSEEPAASASIGQVHRGRWADGREVAVKVQYPGADEALRADLRQIGRVAAIGNAVVPGMDVKALVAEMQERVVEELDYPKEAEAQHVFAEAYADHPLIEVPDVVAVGPSVLITEWVESEGSIAKVIAEGTPEERDHYGELLVRFWFSAPELTGMLHADPHPGNFRVLPDGRLAVLDFGLAARLPERGFPEPMGRLIRIASTGDADALVAGLRHEGFIREGIKVEPQHVLDYLAPFVTPALEERFRFTREWMREEFKRINDPKDPAYTVGLKLNLPPSYLLIHRVWLGGLGVLAQLNAEAPFREILEEHLPGFAG
ncbi:AarF/ABC1/UbiB kinase family protein [Nocardioides sp. NPDC047086]|uniref:ABC1 kinase family protein n=1 Tax=Nocardioides sp. NPDC047086 TaxID=3154810 RepID=UPI0033E240D0